MKQLLTHLLLIVLLASFISAKPLNKNHTKTTGKLSTKEKNFATLSEIHPLLIPGFRIK